MIVTCIAVTLIGLFRAITSPRRRLYSFSKRQDKYCDCDCPACNCRFEISEHHAHARVRSQRAMSCVVPRMMWQSSPY